MTSMLHTDVKGQTAEERKSQQSSSLTQKLNFKIFLDHKKPYERIKNIRLCGNVAEPS